jgi:hypothetical protein
MKKLALCLILLFVSIPLLAGATGIGIGLHGGIEMMVSSAEGAETETFPAIGALVDFSLPGIPIGLRAGGEYSWKSYDVPIIGEYKLTDIIILLAGQYNVVLPGAPMSFYLGAGGQLCMASSDAEGSESSTDFGFLAYGGANYSMGMIGIFAEVGYGMIFSDPESVTNIPIRGGIKFSL